MKTIICSLFFIIIYPFLLNGQSLDFEELDQRNRPVGWVIAADNIKIDSAVKRSGNYSLYMDERSGKGFLTTCQKNILFEGDTVKLTGYARIGNLTGHVRVILSLLGSSSWGGDHIFSDNYIFTNNTNGAWETFELAVPLCRQATHLGITCFLDGSGEVWFDDLELTIDNKTLATAKIRDISEDRPTSEVRFDGHSGFESNGPFTPEQIENMNVLCRVWGLMKYYHPKIASGELDWDYELLKMIRQVHNLDAAHRNRTLLEWINTLGAIDIYDDNRISEIGWIEDTDRFGPALTAKMREIANSKRGPFNYYCNPQYITGIPIFCHETPFPKMDYADVGYRLLSVFRLWNAIEFFYPYRNLTDDRDAMLSESIAFISNPDINKKGDYVEGIYRLLCGINDSHGSIVDPEYSLDHKLFTHMVPFIPGDFVEGKFFVSDVYHTDKCDLRKGDAITHIDGKSALEFIDEFKFRFPSSNFEKLCQKVAHAIPQMTKKDKVLYTVDRDGEIIDVEAKAYSFPELEGIVKGYAPAPADIGHRIMEDSIAYIDMARISQAEMIGINKEYFDYPYLIIDFRNYLNDGASSMLKELLPGTFQIARFWHSDPMRPGNFVTYPGNGDFFTGQNKHDKKIVLIVNHNSQSHLEYTSMMLQNIPGLITIGSHTAGADGNITRVTLPGDITAVFTGLGLSYPDGGQCQGIGIRIDEEVRPTLKGIREGRDELLERAIEIIKRN